jgi:hypothetical protein
MYIYTHIRIYRARLIKFKRRKHRLNMLALSQGKEQEDKVYTYAHIYTLVYILVYRYICVYIRTKNIYLNTYTHINMYMYTIIRFVLQEVN